MAEDYQHIGFFTPTDATEDVYIELLVFSDDVVSGTPKNYSYFQLA